MPASKQRFSLVWQITLIVILIAAIGGLFILLGAFKPPAGSHRVTFRVGADGGFAAITYRDATAKVTDAQQVMAPWKRESDNPSGTQVYLTAGNPSQTGKIQCELLLDNRPWKSSQAVFPQDSVACAGIVP
ncbi:MAG: hypothetical protein M1281_08645 [Chloroflexi bacterium]|nr:hypothetical protein [Chloroflexota bacterium]